MSMQVKVASFVFAAIFALLFFSQQALADRELGALEKFDRSALTIAYISNPRLDGTRYAYIRDPENYNHRVEAGDYLGKQDGKITEIRAKEIVVVELVKVGSQVNEQATTLKCGRPCRNN